jgi:hypothetical protein
LATTVPKKPLPSSSAPAKPAKATAAAAPSALDTFKYKHTAEDAEALASDMIPSTFTSEFEDTNWKTRLSACEAILEWLDSAARDVDAEVLIRTLAKKGWSEKNFQVSKVQINKEIFLFVDPQLTKYQPRSQPNFTPSLGCLPNAPHPLGDPVPL